MAFTKDTKMKDINNAPDLAQAKGHLIGGGAAFFNGDAGELTLEQLHIQQPTWHVDDILYGLERLQQVASQLDRYVYPVYTAQEIRTEPQLAQVQLLHLPAPHKREKSFAILLSGGAYGAVCTLVESLPVAARLNEQGVDCFCLNYRTATQETFTSGLLPKPLDDLAAAWRFIEKNAPQLGVDSHQYFVGGFSAGGHTAALWGTAHLGYRKYGIPAPAMLMLGYPLITTESLEAGPMREYMLTGMYGTGYTQQEEHRYAVHRHVDAAYPKVYLVHSQDDATALPENADLLARAMDVAGVGYKMESPATGGHGFGLGSATPASGWVERAARFMFE